MWPALGAGVPSGTRAKAKGRPVKFDIDRTPLRSKPPLPPQYGGTLELKNREDTDAYC